MKISIVTPSYNQAAYIDECIRSVMLQGYEHFEHVIVDNCSDDGTQEIIKKYNHLKVICEPDKGQCDAINKGVRAATGEWFLWLNADDYLLPGALHSFVEAIQNNPAASVVYSHMQFVNEHGELIKVSYNIRYHYILTKYGAFMPPSTGSMFKTGFFTENPLDNDFHYVMDAEWFLRCGKRVKAVLIDRVNFSFRVSNENKTSSYAKTGKLLPRHAEERRLYKEKYVFPIVGIRVLDEAIYSLMHNMAILTCKFNKLRYAGRYLKNRF